MINYLLLGIVFTFTVDALFEIEEVKNHPSLKDKNWGMKQRAVCLLIWPLLLFVFLFTFIKRFFRK